MVFFFQKSLYCTACIDCENPRFRIWVISLARGGKKTHIKHMLFFGKQKSVPGVMSFEINHLLFTQFIESDFETQRFAMKHLLNVFHDSGAL